MPHTCKATAGTRTQFVTQTFSFVVSGPLLIQLELSLIMHVYLRRTPGDGCTDFGLVSMKCSVPDIMIVMWRSF